MNIGVTISSIRKERKLTQIELANKIGITQTALSQIESGKSRPQPETLKKICEVLNVPEVLIYFLSFDENDVPEEKRALYNAIAPSLKEMIQQLFNKENTK